MAPTPEQIQALADMVSLWRTQEYIFITFYCAYAYYFVTTIHEEVSHILPQKWSRGKALYILTRYPVVLSITLSLAKDYRSYFTIDPDVCKGISVTFIILLKFVAVTCDYSLALCLGALLQAGPLILIALVTLSCGLPIANSILYLIALLQYPAEPTTSVDRALGYACYAISPDNAPEGGLVGSTGQDIRSYLSLAITTVLALLGGITLFVRYKGQGMGLVHVISRDGGIHYLSLVALRLIGAILVAPSLNLSDKFYSSPVTVLNTAANQVLIPILTQRLLINMRKVDYMGSQPVASKLLFAAPARRRGSSPDDSSDNYEVGENDESLSSFNDLEEGSPRQESKSEISTEKREVGGGVGEKRREGEV